MVRRADSSVVRTGSRHKGFKYAIAHYWQLYVLLALPILYLILFNYIPMIGVQIAFRKFNLKQGVWGSPWVGLAQFQKFTSSYMFERLIVNTIRLSVYSLVVGFPFPIIFALMLNTMRIKRYRSFIENVTYLPHFISTVVMVGMLFQWFNVRSGVVTKVFQFVTGGAKMPDIFSKKDLFPHIYVWSGIWQGLGWDTVIFTAALAAVSSELHEAALIDGATRFQRVLHVDLPAIVPTITILLIMRCGGLMNIGFDKVFLMQNSMNQRTSEVISTYVYKQGLTSGGDYSYSTAVGLFNSVINLALISLVNAIARKVGETSLW